MEEQKKRINGLSEGALKTLQKEFVVIGKTRVHSWTAWLLIGLMAGATAGILFVANRSGEFEIGAAQVPPGGGGGGGGGLGTVVFVDNFERPDSTTIGNGWQEIAGDFVIKSGLLQNARRDEKGKKLSGYSLAVLPSILGETQSVGADFYHANYDADPRFGIVLRYKDAKNYYLLYQQLGKRSFLNISKIVNGQETVLSSVSMSNARGGPGIRVEASANGNILEARSPFVSTPLVVSDDTFFKGAVGIYMGSKKDIAHRADNFQANVGAVQKHSITVLSPNGGEVWIKGETKTVQWTSSGLKNTGFLLVLINENGTNYNLGAGNSPYSWNVTVSIPDGKYRFGIQADGLSTHDESDAPFSIVSAP